MDVESFLEKEAIKVVLVFAKGFLPEVTPEVMKAIGNVDKLVKSFDWGKYGDIYENIVQGAVRMTLNGIETCVIVKPHEGKLEESVNLLTEWCMMALPLGAKTSIEVWHSNDEILKMVPSMMKAAQL
ncbi:MAG: hypothetical protein ACFFCS_21040 [Candidatus Hodarchaeota archaeon]